MTIMARTKKQTLENASERKRQIQEEILRESLAAKQKDSNPNNKGNKPPLVASNADHLPHSGAAASGTSEKIEGAGSCRGKSLNSKDSSRIDLTKSVFAMNETQSALSRSPRATSTADQGNLPQAVICIPDICRNPVKQADEESLHGSMEPRPRGLNTSFKACTEAEGVHRSNSEPDMCTFRNKKHSKSHVKKGRNNSKSEGSISNESLKAASEKISDSNGKRLSQPSLTSWSHKKKISINPKASVGRRSPRQHSPVSPSDSKYSQNGYKKNQKNTSTFSDVKPKVNIFTDNMGIDLGKRIRSPRRLSEDMIALPIFSARRWGNLPREGATSIGMSKSPEESSVNFVTDSPSLPANSSSCELFKSPAVSPVSSRKSHTSGSPQKTPSSTGSKNSNDSELQVTPPSTGAKNSKSSSSSRRHRGNRSVEISPRSEPSPSEMGQAERDHSSSERESKAYPLRISKSLVSRELQYTEQAKQQKKSNRRMVCSADKAEDGDKSLKLKSQVTSEEEQKLPVDETDVVMSKEKNTHTQVGEDVEDLMSSVCREFMIDGVISKTSDTDKQKETVEADDAAEIKTRVQRDCVKSVEKNVRSDVSAVEEKENKIIQRTERAGEENAWINSDENVDNLSNSNVLVSPESKSQSSLLCAMLVGGTEVANTYSQERERCKPVNVTAKTNTASTPILPSPCRQNLAVKADHGSDDTSGLHNQDGREVGNRMKENNHPDTQEIDKKGFEKECPLTTESHGQQNVHSNKIKKEFEPVEVAKIEIKEEVDDIPMKSDDNTCDPRERLKIDISSKLSKLNENVLKLLEIDVEEEFLRDVAPCHDPVEASTNKTENESGGGLYSLINSLGDRLKDGHKCDSLVASSTTVDPESVEKLIESCSSHAPCIIPKLDMEGRMQQIQKRLREEELKEKEETQKRQKLSRKAQSQSPRPLAEEDKVNGNCSQSDQTTTDTSHIPGYEKVEEPKDKVIKAKMEDLSRSFGSDDSFTPSLTDFPVPMSSPSSVNDSLCDLDLDAITSAATNAINIGKAKHGADCVKHNSDSLAHSSAKHSFQKSKTCDDFSDNHTSTPSTHPHILRRVNSSPQIYTKPLTSSPCIASHALNAKHETHVKSKLGSKIPVPGTSYTSRCSKKTWRIPRIIMDPKPLSVLSELEEISSQSKNIFTCPNLQKYLNRPSNRIIVPPEKRKEIEELDAQAKDEDHKREMQLQVRAEREKNKLEDKDKKTEEEISAEYAKYEPDFDEVDGMLFMSFSNEVELAAHVRVEKALDWDKDDTMLRISRAKAFEEAKAHNDDMRDYKFKHLRGQHMRWKKYRRLYSCEVKTLLEAHEKGIPLETLASPKKTSDITKIKGWRKRKSISRDSVADGKVSMELPVSIPMINNIDHKEDGFSNSIDDDLQFLGESIPDHYNEENEKPELSPRSKRRQGFSHQKAHKQLFRELGMDWEDRMIHRKLGGWSLKGNRPKAFSQAAIKRQEKECKGFEDSLKLDIRDTSLDLNMQVLQGDMEAEPEPLPEGTEHCDIPKKKKTSKLNYPLLTEKMARNALRTLETGAISRSSKKKKKRQNTSNIPALSPIAFPVTPLLGVGLTTSLSGTSTAGSQSVSSPSPYKQYYSQSVSSSASTGTTPLELDLREEPVMEGVDTAMENISSPSLAETSSSKSCGKPGCRYGCICHLCSANEASAPPRSPQTKPVTPACDKEYCRLGCICDSIDPDKQLSSQAHCGKSSCMLQCVCADQGSQDGNEEIPFLPSMKRRPKPGERFSNLPQRERTHRSAKNLDAITRKALMLYETSEIYCEKIERVKKKPDVTSSPSTTPIVSPSLSFTASPSPNVHIPSTSIPASDPDIITELDDSNTPADILFSAVNLETSEATTVAASHLLDATSSSYNQHQLSSRRRHRSTQKGIKPAIVIDDVRQTLPIVEQSAHKRKRKSHPLSDEIFTLSTYARAHSLRDIYQLREKFYAKEEVEEASLIPKPLSSSTISGSSYTSSSQGRVASLNKDNKRKQICEPETLLPKISSVQTLAPNASDAGANMPRWEDMESGVSVEHSTKESAYPSAQFALGSSNKCQSSSVPKQIATSKRRTTSGGSSRQNHGWHTSMVCLKARAPRPSQPTGEEDIQEEDEVKLLEFAANCNWEGAKKEILGKVAQCLSMGQYPQPRTMNVCEFVVEILPKAHQPSLIPPELRAKLPGQMYSIRVRITRRETVHELKSDLEPQVIDLSEPSPVKAEKDCGIRCPMSSSVVKHLSESFSSTPSNDSQSLTRSSSFGISGLSKLHISNTSLGRKPGYYKLNEYNQLVRSNSVKSSSAPNSRRASCESNVNDKGSELSDGKSILSDNGNKVTVSSFMKIESGTSLKSTSNSLCKDGSIHIVNPTSSKVSVTTPAYSVKSSCGKSTTSKKEDPRSSTTVSLNASKTVPPTVTPVIGPFNSKDFKFMKIPGSEGMVKILKMGGPSDKKKLIAVPVTFSKTTGNLKGKQGSVPIVALPVNATRSNKILPTLTSPAMSTQFKTSAAKNSIPQQFVLKLPAGAQAGLCQSSTSGVGKPLVVHSVQVPIKGQSPKFHVVPVAVDVHGAGEQTKVTATEAVVTGTTDSFSSQEVSGPKTRNSNDEMIMVFDAAHVKASQSKPSTSTSKVSPDGKETTENSQGTLSTNLTNPMSSTLVTSSRDRPIMSSGISLSKGLAQLDGSADLTEDKMTKATRNGAEKKDSHSKTSEAVDECDGCAGEHVTTDKISSESNIVFPEKGLKSLDHKIDCVLNKDTLTNTESHPNSEDIPALRSTMEAKQEYVILVSSSSSLEAASQSEKVSDDVDTHSSASDTTCSVPKSFMTAREPSLWSSSTECSSKQSFGSSTAVEEESVSVQKRPRLIRENLMTVNEDSNISVNSEPDFHTANAIASLAERPKSVMSTTISSCGSSDDILIMLSSDEDIDVGVEACNGIHKERAERALEKDHGTMYSKETHPNLLAHFQETMSETIHFKLRDRHLDKNRRRRNHTQLERKRRSRLRVLFDELQSCILGERGLPEDHFMSRVKVLAEAKDIILSLNSTVEHGDLAIKLQEKQNESLRAKLDALKDDLLQKNVSSDAIDAVLTEAVKEQVIHPNSSARQRPLLRRGLSEAQLSLHIELDPTADTEENHEMVNLVSPSSDGDKDSDRQNPASPVYEDISDPEEPTAPCYEDITDVEEAAETKYEDISDPENG